VTWKSEFFISLIWDLNCCSGLILPERAEHPEAATAIETSKIKLSLIKA
jgi:hypothetical protein